jgi:hypothetical protein
VSYQQICLLVLPVLAKGLYAVGHGTGSAMFGLLTTFLDMFAMCYRDSGSDAQL